MSNKNLAQELFDLTAKRINEENEIFLTEFKDRCRKAAKKGKFSIYYRSLSDLSDDLKMLIRKDGFTIFSEKQSNNECPHRN